MKHSLLVLLVSYLSLVYCVKWEDCGTPLSRKIYYQTVVVSPSSISIADQQADRSIDINVGAYLQNYTLGEKYQVSSYLQVIKDKEVYMDILMGDLCTMLSNNNREKCPLKAGYYSYSYLYQLPPLPTGNYTIKLIHRENSTQATQIGCLAAQIQVIGLGLDACKYSSELSAVFAGTAQFLDDNNVIQIGPWGPGGTDLGYPWGTFKSITATPDLVGYALKPDNFVWGLRGSLRSARQNTFEGTMVIGYLPDTSNYKNAVLVYQGLFSWVMTPSDNTPYVFESGTFDLVPSYYYPTGFPYPLNIGNLGTFSISQSKDRSFFSISSTRSWCRCNCDIGGVGHDDSLKNANGNSNSSMSGFKKGTIAIAVIGSFILIVAAIVIIRLRRSKPRPVVYDDADLMDPQKPDYGTMAINDAFDAQDQEFD